MKIGPLPISFAMFLLFPVALSAQPKPTEPRSKEAVIRELLDITGSGKMGVQIVNQMIANFKQGAPEIEHKIWDRFSSKVDPNEMVDLVVPIYDKYLTREELEEIIAFYKSPTGKKVISVMPVILNESMAAGEQWGKKLGDLAIKELEAEQKAGKTAPSKQ